MIPRRHWAEHELQLLRLRYSYVPTEDIASELGRTARSIYQMAEKLGLRKSPEYLASPAARRWDGKRGGATRFAPGLTPWNKGKPGTTGTQEGCRATQFKPGRAPSEAPNYRPIGSHRVTKDGYLEQKVSDDKTIARARRWVAVHRLVWEESVGPIPPGFIVRFKRGMATLDLEQITVDRLECVSRSEHMKTHTYHQYGPEVARLTQLRGAIQRQINKRAKEST